MKKNYIIPNLKVIDLGTELNSCLTMSETVTDEQWGREERHFDSSEEGSTSNRNLWSNEW